MELHPECVNLTGRLARLDKSLNGLKQVSHELHNKLLSSELIDYGFEQRLTDTSVSRKLSPCDRREDKMVLLSHVHDLFIAGSDSSMDSLEKHLNKFFETNLSGELVKYSGRSFVRYGRREP